MCCACRRSRVLVRIAAPPHVFLSGGPFTACSRPVGEENQQTRRTRRLAGKRSKTSDRRSLARCCLGGGGASRRGRLSSDGERPSPARPWAGAKNGFALHAGNLPRALDRSVVGRDGKTERNVEILQKEAVERWLVNFCATRRDFYRQSWHDTTRQCGVRTV